LGTIYRDGARTDVRHKQSESDAEPEGIAGKVPQEFKKGLVGTAVGCMVTMDDSLRKIFVFLKSVGILHPNSPPKIKFI
jgi:hypothetical protein